MAWTVDGLSYTTRKKLTVDQTKIDTADLTDFPCLVKLSAANFDFSHANADGFDIRFTAANGSTLLKYERERHDNANELAEYWVKIPTVEYDADTDFYMYYRTTDTADGADAANVWDSSYLGVYHLYDDDTGTTIVDSKATNNLTKKANAEPSQDDGLEYKGQHYDGSDDVITHATLFDTFPSAFMIEGWVKFDVTFNSSSTTEKGFWRKYNLIGGPWGYAYVSFQQLDGRIQYQIYTDATYQCFTTTASWTAGTWYHIAFKGGSGGMEIWVNGVSEDTDASTVMPGNGTNSDMMVGNVNTAFDGVIDEFRISNSARTSGYVKASYNSGANTLLTYGAEDSGTNIKSFNGLAKASIKSVNGLAIASVKSINSLT
jgi:hypothetical protein